MVACIFFNVIMWLQGFVARISKPVGDGSLSANFQNAEVMRRYFPGATSFNNLSFKLFFFLFPKRDFQADGNLV